MRKVQVNSKDKAFEFELRQDKGIVYIRQNGFEHKADLVRMDKSRYSLIIDGASYEIGVNASSGDYSISTGSRTGEFRVEDFEIAKMKRRAGIEDTDKDKQLTAPMPGLIVAIKCEAGQLAKRGEPLLIMEAMKMENEIKSPVAGKIKNITVSAGQNVDKGQLLVEFE